MLTKEEKNRYARHLNLPDFGEEQQLKLKRARVLVIGAGGLGSPVLLYLAAAGVGYIGIVEFDEVDESNLQRQVLYGSDDIGESKARTAKAKLEALNPHIHIEIYETALRKENAMRLIAQYDVIADGTDNFPTRYLVNDACVLAGKPNVFASIFRYEGQASVFNLLLEDGTRSPNYRDVFPEPPPPNMVPNCAEGGVIGVLAGIMGTLQANEVIKIITGIGEPLVGRLFLFDSAAFISRTLKYKKRPDTNITELIDYDAFCGVKTTTVIKQLNVSTLKEMMDAKETYTLVDVRESSERAVFSIGGLHIPMADIPASVTLFPKNEKVIVYCHSGIRSREVVRFLQENYTFDNLYNLEDGMVAWRQSIES